MDYNDEADYIESIDVSAPGKSFNNDLYVFIKYCNMQYNGAVKDKQTAAADRIAAVRNTAFDMFHKANS